MRQIERTTDGRYTLFLDKGEPVSGFDVIMFATGRSPNTHRPDLNLAAVGVELDAAGAIKVRPTVCASLPHHTRTTNFITRASLMSIMQRTALTGCVSFVRSSRLQAAIEPRTQVDEYSRTTKPGVWAIGDVTNRVNLTPVALMVRVCQSGGSVLTRLRLGLGRG
jgi:pyruvate/2-oxoglutarate dehydrogenase complex dihydrolipoamide dehydrogenase (E3) component